MWKHSRMHQVAAVTLCLVAVVAVGVVRGDENRPTGNVSQQCEKANSAAESRFQFIADSWRQHVADLRRLDRLRRVASDAAGFDEKISQGLDLFETPGGRVDRMRASIRKHVVDERVLAKSMADAFAAYQKELLDATVALYGNTGIGRATAQKAISPAKFDPAPLERAFDPVVIKVKSIGPVVSICQKHGCRLRPRRERIGVEF